MLLENQEIFENPAFLAVERGDLTPSQPQAKQLMASWERVLRSRRAACPSQLFSPTANSCIGSATSAVQLFSTGLFHVSLNWKPYRLLLSEEGNRLKWQVRTFVQRLRPMVKAGS